MTIMIIEATSAPAKMAAIKPAVSTSTLVNGPMSAVVANNLVVMSAKAGSIVGRDGGGGDASATMRRRLRVIVMGVTERLR